MWNWLKGKKTYIVATLLALLNLAVSFGWISPAHLDQINAILVALGLGALRHAAPGNVQQVEVNN